MLASTKTGSNPFFYSKLVVVFCFFLLRNATAQTEFHIPDSLKNKPFGIIFELPIKARFVCADAQLNCYVITEKNEILSYGDQGQPIARYTNQRLGPATKIDASLPNGIVVWYAEFHTAVWLDQSLTEIAQLDLRKVGLEQVKLLANASDNGLWVYDEATFQVKKINQKGKEVSTSAALNVALKRSPTPVALQEFESQVFLTDSVAGLYCFDQVGQFSKTIDLKNVRDAQIFDWKFMYVADKLIHGIFIKSPNLTKIVALPGDLTGTESCFVQKRRIYAIRPDKVQAWIFGINGN